MHFKKATLAAITMTMGLTGCAGTGAVGSLMSTIADNARMLVGSSIEFYEAPANMALMGHKSIDVSPMNAESDRLSFTIRDIMTVQTTDGLALFKHDPSNATARIVANMTSAEPSSQRTLENRMQCPGTKMVRSCKAEEARHYKVSCTVNSMTVRGSATITDLASGRMIASPSSEFTATDKVCSDESRNLRTQEALMAEAGLGLARDLAGEYAPTTEKKPNELARKTDGLSDADAQRLEAAYNGAKDGAVQMAAAEYAELSNRHPSNADLAFGAAYLAHAVGDYARALALYERAAALGAKESLVAKYKTDVEVQVQRGVRMIAAR